MKYEVSKWYRWGGGECPVHPMSWVEVFIVEEDLFYEDDCHAEAFDWNSELIVAFKVVEEYKEPREYWALISNQDDIPLGMYKTRAEAERYRFSGEKIVKVREVKD